MTADKRYAFLAIFSVLLFASLFATQPARAEEECLKNAWGAYNNADYAKAIGFADQCIDEFGKAADRDEDRLTKEGEAPPPTGAVNPFEKNKIFQRGLLNDVGTSYFVKGRSAEYLYKQGGPRANFYKEVAEAAFKACRYRYARTWDPKGWFWSPCDAAADRLPVR